MKQSLIILGASGTGRDVVDIISDINSNSSQFKILGFLDDKLVGTEVMGLSVLGKFSMISQFTGCLFVNALGSPSNFRQRPEIIQQLNIPSDRFANIVHPSVVQMNTAKIGGGCILYPNVVLMSKVILGNHITVLGNTTINHDCTIGSYSIITSGVQISGNVKIDDCCYIGTGSSIIQNAHIGENTLVGMGSVVLTSIEANSKVYGNPVRI
jgi:sugar O-acyltransferase (sialic acid O-acetyltransferase NeuD family)